MTKLKYFLFLFLFLPRITKAQKYNTVTLVEQRSYYLNGGARASMGGKSRVVVKIDLPPNTKSWYYSFSTTPDEKATKMLNLGLQVAAASASVGASMLAASAIEVPSGSGSIDILVLPIQYRDVFLQKQDDKLRFFADISMQNVKQAVQSINNNAYGNAFYLGLKNPSMMNGINIQLEVVAIVEEVNADLDKAVMFCNLGWKAYEKGELEKCAEFSKKALNYNPKLSTAKFNIALVQLVQEKDEALEQYVNAISESKQDQDFKHILTAALEDLKKIKEQKPQLKNLNDVEELLQSELNSL